MEMVEDRLSSLPDDVIHQIFSRFDTKFAVRTCVLSSRWKLVWKSMPCLNFSSRLFPDDLRTFAMFVSHRNHQIQVSSVNLYFHGRPNKSFVKKIAKYAFSHNVQELTLDNWPTSFHVYPPCLFTSQSLKHFTFSSYSNKSACVTPRTPWVFPSLTTLHLCGINLCGDLFSKCVNLKKLTLKCFHVIGVELFNIITPRLSNLTLIDGYSRLKVINVIAPQLENLTINNCKIDYLNAPPGLASFCYRGYDPIPLSKDGFHSLNKATIFLSTFIQERLYEEEYACEIINMLKDFHSAKYLTLNADIIECISSFPDLLSRHSSPFSNVICLTIDSSMMDLSYKVKMSNEARNFLLNNSPTATTLIMDRWLRTRCLSS